MIENVLNSLAVSSLVLLSSLALYLPLCALIKDRKIAVRYAIPFSISIEIIIGYIFYCTNTVRYFPLSYLLIVVILNVFALFRLRLVGLPKPKIKLSSIFVWAAFGTAILFTRYYDAFSFISPGNNDTFNHIAFVRDLNERGYLSNGFYAPGFHLFMMPISKLISFHVLYRFAGPAIGTVSALAFALLLKDHLKNKVLQFLLIGFLTFPIYNQLTLQTMGFFSSALTFILFTSFITLIKDIAQSTKISLVLFSIFSVCLALTVPYLLITIIPAYLITYLIILIARKNFSKRLPRYILFFNLILAGGLIISFLHVFVQSSVLERYYGFPNVQVAPEKPIIETETDIQKIDSGELTDGLHLPKFVTNNSFLNPIIGTSIDILKIKNIRSASSVLGLGGYLWIAFSVFLVMYSIRKKNAVLLTIAACSIVFGLATQTGILEISTYRGRSGWYLLLLSLMGIIMFFDELKIKKILNWVLGASLILAASGFLYPPIFYRPYYEDEFKRIKNISQEYRDKIILVVAREKYLRLVAPNIETLELNPSSLGKDNTFVVIEKKIFKPDPTLSQAAISTDKNFSQYNKRFEILNTKLSEKNEQIMSSEQFSKFSKIFEDENFEIFSNIN